MTGVVEADSNIVDITYAVGEDNESTSPLNQFQMNSCLDNTSDLTNVEHQQIGIAFTVQLEENGTASITLYRSYRVCCILYFSLFTLYPSLSISVYTSFFLFSSPLFSLSQSNKTLALKAAKLAESKSASSLFKAGRREYSAWLARGKRPISLTEEQTALYNHSLLLIKNAQNPTVPPFFLFYLFIVILFFFFFIFLFPSLSLSLLFLERNNRSIIPSIVWIQDMVAGWIFLCIHPQRGWL